MSQTIEERVVRMDFDNDRFEKNVKTSLDSVNKLESALNFDGLKKGTQNVDDAIKGFHLGGVGNAVDTVREKFSLMEVAALTAFENIVNSAVNAGKQLVNSFTIDPIKDGFAEYELKMGSVQTIMASTGVDLQTVNKYLAELNTYADKTIYSFSDMTASIGKFTNAGVDLDSAVKAIQGISNEAAVSGANANEASHAMYNFAQALSAGSVKLIDWKSIENANMATVEFKQELIDTAVELGTLTKEGDKYVSTTKDMNGKVSEAFDATSMFNDSLSSQWMTTDVLVKTLGEYADETTDLGKKAFAAAQDVKTFSQLMDTLKEAVGSGWATTFEILFGDFEEAKQLWTDVNNVVGGFVDKTSDARNALLSEWDELGGRASVIQSIKNSFDALLTVINPIKNAFDKLFPPITAKRLAEITKNIEKFTEKLKLSESNSAKLESVFLGIFSVIKLVASGFKDVVIAVSPLVRIFGLLGQIVLDYASVIGVTVFKFEDLISKFKAFETACMAVRDILNVVMDTLWSGYQTGDSSVFGLMLSNIKEHIKEFGPLGEFLVAAFVKIQNAAGIVSEKLKELWTSLTKGSDGITGFTDNIKALGDTMREKLAPVMEPVSKVIETVGNGFKKFFDIVKSGLKNANFNTIIDLLNVVALGGIGVGIKKLTTTIGEGFGKIGGFADAIKTLLDKVSNALDGFQKSLDINNIKQIAIAIGILAASLFVLSTLDSEKLAQSLGVVSAMMMELIVVVTAISGLNGLDGLKDATKGLKGFATAILILAVALKVLDGIEPQQMATNVLALTVLIAELTAVSILMSKNESKMVKGSLGLIAFAAALVVMSQALTTLSAIEPTQLLLATAVLSALMWELIGISVVMSSSESQMVKGSRGLIKFASALSIMANAVSLLGTMDTMSMIQGLAGISAIMASLVLYSITIDPSTIKNTSLSILVISAAMRVMADAMVTIGSLDVEGVAKAVLGIAGVLTSIALASNLIDEKRLLAMGASMVAIANGMETLSEALKLIGDMQPEQIAFGLTGLLGVLMSLALFLQLMEGNASTFLTAAPSMVVMAFAIKIMAGALVTLGGLSLEQVGAGLLALGGSLTILAVGALALKQAKSGVAVMLVMATAVNILIPPLISLSKVNIKKIGTGLLALAGAFAVMGAAAVGFALLVKLFSSMVIPMLAVAAAFTLLGVAMIAIGKGLVTVSAGILAFTGAIATVGALTAGASALVIKGVSTMVKGVVKGIAEGISDVIAAIKKRASSISKVVIIVAKSAINGLKSIISPISKLVDKIIETVLNKINKYIVPIVQTGVKVVKAFLNGINQLIGPVVQTGIHILISFMKGIRDNIRNIVKLGVDIVVNFLRGVADNIKSVVDAGVDLVVKFAEGVGENVEPIITAGVDLVGNIIIGIIRALPDIFKKGGEIVTELKNGLGDVKNDLFNAGKNAVQGFINGIVAMPGQIARAGSEIANKLLNSVKSKLKEHSPSKAMEKIGRYAIMGLAIGIEKMEPAVMTTAGEVGSGMAQRMFDSINNTLNKTLSSKGFSGLQKIFSFISKSYEKNVDKYLQKMISDRIAPQYLTSAMVAYTKAVLDNANKIYKSYTSLLSKLDKDTKRFVLSMPEVTVAYIQNVGDVTQYAASSIKQFTSQYSKALKSSGVTNVKGVAAGAIQSFATKLYLNSDEYKQSMSNLRSYYQENEKLEARRAKQSEKLKSLEQDRTKSVKEINKLKKAEANNAKNVSAKESEIKAIEEELAQIERDKRSDNLAALENERAQLDVKKKKNQAAALDKRIEAAKNANYKADLMDRKKALQSELKQLKTNQKNAEKNTKNAKDGLKDINKSIKETKKNINSIDKEIAQNNKKVEKEATRIAQGAMKALKKYRKELRGMVKDFMSISNIATEKLITGFSAIMPSTNLATEMTRNFDFLGVTFEKVASAAENVTEASSEATEEMVDGLSDVAETLDLFNVKFDTGIDLFTKFTKTGSAEVQALFEHADSALEAYNEYQSGLEQMRAMGFDEALISELENKGADSINYVRGFLKMNESEVDQYNERINKKAEWESKKIASEMNKELATYENWVNNIEELAARGLSEGIINKLKDGGVGQAAFVSALVAADDTTLSKIDELYSGYVYTNYEIALNQPQDVYSDYVETETDTAVDTAETGGEAVATSFKEALYKEMNDKSDYENKLDFVKMVGLDDRIIEELREKGHEAGSAIVDSIIEDIMGGKDVSISDIVKINELRKQESELKSVVDEGVKNLENLSTQRNKALANLDRLERDRVNPKYIDAARKEYEKINDAYNDNLYTVQKASQEYIKTKEKLYELSNSYSILSESVKEYNDIYNKSINQGKSPAEKWLEDMQTTLNTKKDWDKNLKKIAKSEGEDSAIYQQIKDMGWEAGSEYAAAYLAADKQTKKELRASAEEIAKINRDNIVATYKERNDTVLQMAEDLENITNRTVKPGLEKSKQAMLDEMSTWGPDMAEQMAVIASLDDKQFEKVVSTYKAGTGKTASAFADTFISSLSMAFSGMEAGLNSLGINTITGISNGLNNEDAKNKLKKSSTKVANDVISPIKNTLKISSPSKVMITVGKNVLAGLSNGLSQTANVIKVAKGVSEDVKDALKTYLNKAKGQQIGENVVAGIASGMTSKSSMSAIAEAAATLAESVVSSLQDELEIESPSKVLRDEVGIFVGLGVSEGIMASENSVKSASESLGDSTINALKEAFDRAKRIMDSEIEFDPVITPTLDLSNVRNRAKTLNSMIASVDANVYGSSYDDASTNNPLNQNDGMTFIQNNYSPKALDQLEIFRQTRNQFAMVRNIVGAV